MMGLQDKKIYLNGEFLTQQLITYPGVLYDFSNFSFIGSGSNGQSKFVGKIDDLFILESADPIIFIHQ